MTLLPNNMAVSFCDVVRQSSIIFYLSFFPSISSQVPFFTFIGYPATQYYIMAPRQSKTAKRNKTQNKTRTVDSEVFSDSAAKNLLADQPKLTPKSKVKRFQNWHLKTASKNKVIRS